MMNRVDWDNQLISIRGARGVGKSYLLRQYIKLNYPEHSRKALYCSADALYFSSHTLVQLAEELYHHGGELLVIDEIHLYPHWSREIKEIYDTLPELKVVISGSSLLNILNADADLSRRCLPYEMPGLSFREYLRFYHGVEFEAIGLEELLENSTTLCRRVNDVGRPLALWKDYLRYGYYPFYRGKAAAYQISLENTINFIIDVELPRLCEVDVANSRKIKALLGVLANNVPYQLDITKLSSMLSMSRATVLQYLQYLSRASVLSLLYSDLLSVKKLQKPDKIYLQNPNLLFLLSRGEPNIGTVRETFAINQLMTLHEVEYGKEKGDLLVDGTYTFEIGGPDKTFDQIADMPRSYVFSDGIEYSSGKKLPLWLLGFLY